jgi:hypothetical protein
MHNMLRSISSYFRVFRRAATCNQVQTVLRRKPRARYPKQRHAFMGLLTCGRCGCAMTAEKKKGRYVYYRCTGSRGRCDNAYIREEQLADLLGTVVRPIQITPEIADDIASALRSSEVDGEQRRLGAVRRLEQRRHVITSKLDRGYDDYVSDKISDEFWTRKSKEWEAELQLIEAEHARIEQSRLVRHGNSHENLRTRETGRISLQIAESGRTASVARNSAIELHV